MISGNPTSIAIIPARMGSSRFPGKPMEQINGIPMIGHVFYRTKLVRNINTVCVATCDTEIYEYIKSIGGLAIMTSKLHETASDRAAEALGIVQKMHDETYEIVALIQGDEPMFDPSDVQNAIEALILGESENIVNLMNSSDSEEEFIDFNNVKVVVDQNNYAMYFSREPIPSRWKSRKPSNIYIQTGLIIFKTHYLKQFLKMKITPLERFESCDMLRVLENGDKILMLKTKTKTIGVDTKEDLKNVNKFMANDLLSKKYN